MPTFKRKTQNSSDLSSNALSRTLSPISAMVKTTNQYKRKASKERNKYKQIERQEENITNKLITQISFRLDHIENNMGTLSNCS